jgi:uncharacterized protein YggU (UPF0235/DUF167 family)
MIQIGLHVRPGARTEKVSLSPDGSLLAWVRAPALDGRANAAVVEAVARALSLRPRQVRLVRGQRSRQKLVEIDLPSPEALARRLTPAAKVE